MNRTTRRGTALRSLLGPDGAWGAAWKPEDLRAILVHQWQAPLAGEAEALLRHAGSGATDMATALKEHGQLTFGALLASPRPPAALLDVVKRHAKATMEYGEDLPHDVAHVLYLLAILRARAVGLPPISRLGAAALRQQAHRCLALGWLPPEVRDLVWASVPPAPL